jgi:hypothetical protein
METIFKVGDKVFDYTCGWGEVNRVDFNVESFWPVGVIFESENTEAYTFDGRHYSTQAKTLSFTEYTLKGFSQERFEELPNKGDIVWVRDYENEEWNIRYFVHKFESEYYVTSRNPFAERQNGSYYKFLTTKNPYEK